MRAFFFRYPDKHDKVSPKKRENFIGQPFGQKMQTHFLD
jgi:hypothetical protein